MKTGFYSFVCYQGSTFQKQLTFRVNEMPVDLTGWTGRMQVRQTFRSKTYIVNLTTENGGIILGGPEGTIDIYISAAQTKNFKDGKYVYDIELVTNEYVHKLLQGHFIIKPEVTR